MLTYTSRRNLFGKLTGDSGTNNLSLGDTLINEADREVITAKPWGFRQASTTQDTETDNIHNLPADCSRVVKITVTIGNVKYTPRRVTTREEWDYLTQSTNTTSDTPEAYFVFGKTYSFYPAPASSTDSAVTVVYARGQKDLSVADYTTGTITSIANGATTVTGSSTVWTAKMVGRYIRFTDSDTANTGDGEWYEIASVTSATVLELATPYAGISISAGTAAYTIGQTSIIPEEFQILSVYRACEIYFTSVKIEEKRAVMYKNLFGEGMKRMQVELGSVSI